MILANYRLARLGDCYSPATTKTNFPARALFIEIYKEKYQALAQRLLGCTPKAWEKIKDDKSLLTALSKDIGKDGKGEITEQTIIALNRKGLYPEFMCNNTAGLFALSLLSEKNSSVLESVFSDLREPTDRNLRIFERATGKQLNLYNLSMKGRRQLLEKLKTAGISFSQIERVIIAENNYFEIISALYGKLTIVFGEGSNLPDTGYLNWAATNL